MSIDSNYLSGYQYATAMVQKFPKKWNRFGIFTYQNGPLWETKGIFLSPEQLLLALAFRERANQVPTILFIDANREHSFSLRSTIGLAAFQHLIHIEESNLPIFRFGEGPTDQNNSLSQLRIDLEWLGGNPAAIVKVIEDISPLEKTANIETLEKKEDLAKIENIASLLQEILGPPSITDDVREKLRKGKDTGKEAAGIASAAVQAAVNPTLLLFRGAKYVYAFAKLLSNRRTGDRKEMLSEWQESIETAYQPEEIAKFVGRDSSFEKFFSVLKKEGIAIILNYTYDSYYDVFIPALITQIRNQWEGPSGEGIALLDGAAYLLKSRYAEELVLGLAEFSSAWRTVSFVHTYDPPEEARLNEITRRFVQEAAVIFDVAPEHFEFAFQSLAVSQRAWLLRRFEEIAKLHQRKKLGYLTYDQDYQTPWSLRDVRPSARQWLTERIRATREALSSLTSTTKDFLDDILGEKGMPKSDQEKGDRTGSESSNN
jgi:hypothetical protein